MSGSYDPVFSDYTRRVNSDREEAVLFLANIIAKKERDLIRSKMNSEPDFGARQHMFLGMNVRNALRSAGFFYDAHTMDYIWYDWLKEAVSLPGEKVALTDNIKTRMNKYKEFMRKERNTPWASEKVLMTSMAFIALALFIISFVLHWFA